MHCARCKQEITQISSDGPIIVSIRSPKNDGYVRLNPSVEVNFCCWECAALWFNIRAGEILMPDLDTEFFSSDEHMRKWG
jgi:hypothetical protein